MASAPTSIRRSSWWVRPDENAGRPDRVLSGLGQDLAPAEHVAVEGRRAADVAHVEDQVAELSYRHAFTLPVASGPRPSRRHRSAAERIQCAVGGMPGPRWMGTSKGSGSSPAASISSRQRVGDRGGDVPEAWHGPGVGGEPPVEDAPVAHDGDVQAHAVHHRAEGEHPEQLAAPQVQREVRARARWTRPGWRWAGGGRPAASRCRGGPPRRTRWAWRARPSSAASSRRAPCAPPWLPWCPRG